MTWLGVVLVLVGLGSAAAWALTSATRGPVFVEPATEHVITPPRTPARAPGVLWLAGSGTNLPLTTRLARAYVHDALGLHPVVHESIGSSGGLAALRDGVIDVALVSRPAREGELGPEFRVVPYARAAVVFAAHVDVPIRRVTVDDVIALYTRQRTTWRTNHAVKLLLREPGDSGTQAVLAAISGFADADAVARRHADARVLYRDGDMQDALLNTSGAIGLFDLGIVQLERLPIRVLAFDEVVPSLDTLRDGSYPLTKTLSFVVREPLDPTVARFLAFVDSPAGRAQIEAGGYLPLPPSPSPAESP